MRNKIFIFLFLLCNNHVNAQQHNSEDSLRAIINQQKGDTTEINTLVYLAIQLQPDSGIKYAQQGLTLAKEINFKKGEADCNLVLADQLRAFRNYTQAIVFLLKASNLYEDLHYVQGITEAYLLLQADYRSAGDYKNALAFAIKGQHLAEVNMIFGRPLTFEAAPLAPLFLAEIAKTYLQLKLIDSALNYTQKAINQNVLFGGATWNFPIYLMGNIQTIQGKYTLAMEHYRSALPLAIKNGFLRDTLQIFSGISTLYKKMGELDSAIHYAKAVTNKRIDAESDYLLLSFENLIDAYRQEGNKDSMLKFIGLASSFKDSIYSNEKVRELQNITFNEQSRKQELATAQLQYQGKLRVYALATGLLLLLLIAAILWRNNLHRRKAYDLLARQKQEIESQKAKIEETLNYLKSTQSQLIQSEKMASLGELTAGIAHEIQNPLNFVNNFSEVNKELADELELEIDKGNYTDAKAIARDIKENQEKINHHGKRADAIVKGMLLHSRISSDQKVQTDINALADEYLRLSYHGLRAKDKSFNTTLKTDFDRSIGNIQIIPQDIGRVLLNLYNNAFYVVSEKKKHHPENYEPMIYVSTKKMNGKVEISIKDNGDGISQKVLDKIFQPFFTTKPAGQGTGLGLSLAYDIVKAHGGELKVETKEGEGSEFIIELLLA